MRPAFMVTLLLSVIIRVHLIIHGVKRHLNGIKGIHHYWLYVQIGITLIYSDTSSILALSCKLK